MAAFSAGKGAIYGAAADRPAAAAQNAGVEYLATDTGAHYISTGSAWVLIWTGGATPVFSGCRVHATGTPQVLSDTVVTAINFDTEDFDTDGYHEGVTHPSRLTVPAAGYYTVEATAGFATGTGPRQWRLVVNNTTPVALRNLNTTVAGGDYSTVSSGPILLAANDYVELQMYQNAGGNLSLVNASAYTPYLSIQRVG